MLITNCNSKFYATFANKSISFEYFIMFVLCINSFVGVIGYGFTFIYVCVVETIVSEIAKDRFID